MPALSASSKINRPRRALILIPDIKKNRTWRTALDKHFPRRKEKEEKKKTVRYRVASDKNNRPTKRWPVFHRVQPVYDKDRWTRGGCISGFAEQKGFILPGENERHCVRSVVVWNSRASDSSVAFLRVRLAAGHCSPCFVCTLNSVPLCSTRRSWFCLLLEENSFSVPPDAGEV